MAREGEIVNFHSEEGVESGLILKIYKQIGFEDHGSEMAVIKVKDEGLNSLKSVISVKIENIIE
tara:strand:+ start:674 stop:865 length:192 start_codon:yes stop_codon:yes gene_type:complete